MPPTRRRYASKWLTLVLCEAVMMSSGTLYLFPVYSPTLKRTLDLTQEQLNFVGSAAHLGAFFSLFGGLFFDAFGARATLAPSWRSQKLYCSRRASGSRPRRKRAAMKICAPSSFESERRITRDAAGACSRSLHHRRSRSVVLGSGLSVCAGLR